MNEGEPGLFCGVKEAQPAAETLAAPRDFPEALTLEFEFGGADGIRTHDLLDAIEARSQLRHGPTREQRWLFL